MYIGPNQILYFQEQFANAGCTGQPFSSVSMTVSSVCAVSGLIHEVYFCNDALGVTTTTAAATTTTTVAGAATTTTTAQNVGTTTTTNGATTSGRLSTTGVTTTVPLQGTTRPGFASFETFNLGMILLVLLFF